MRRLARVAGSAAIVPGMLPLLGNDAAFAQQAGVAEHLGNLECDVLVVGAGLAGSIAAIVAARAGSKVVMIDRSASGIGEGNTTMTSGFINTGGRPVRADPAELYDFVMAEGIAYPQLVRAWSATCTRALDFLEACGVARDNQLEPESPVTSGPVYKRDTGRSTLTKLKTLFLESGGVVVSGVEAIKLLPDAGSIRGVIARKGADTAELRARTTVLASGGFNANTDMLRRYIGPHADRCILRGSRACTGDALRLAMEVDAKAVNLKYFYGHLHALKALSDDRFWPYPRLDNIVDGGLLVDRRGNRFVDEGRGDVAVANEVARSDDPTSYAMLFDQDAWERSKDRPSKYSQPPNANPWLVEKGGDLHVRETAGQLADALGVDRANLERNLESVNTAVRAGNAAGLPIPRTGLTRPLTGPFYGLKVVPGITITMGGLLINGHAEVLNEKENPIEGLYAAGDAIGGLMGGPRGGYFGGVLQAVVTGMLAGEHASARAAHQ
jgi:succinate dehydrogenase/fumarate reductase flavoprotein subunit